MKNLLVTALIAASFTAVSAPAMATPHHRDGQFCSSLIAHRGGAFDYTTENGMAGIAASHDLGISTFEVDVRTSKDNTLWIMHDETIDRTTTGTGTVSQMTGKELRTNITLNDGGYIPNISDILSYASTHDMIPVLHLKGMTPESWDRLRTRVNDFGMVYTVILFGNASTINTAKAEMSRPTKALEFNPNTTALPSSTSGISILAVSEARTTQQTVANAVQHGFVYWVGTPIAQEDWDNYHAWGVRGMFINNVSDYLATCA